MNLLFGQAGFDIISPDQTAHGQWVALRLVVVSGVEVNDIDLSPLDELWVIGLYFYGNILKIVNGSQYSILAYRSGNKETEVE